MPSQGKIISAVNLCLKQETNIDFELNKKGVCAGLAALYVKYALENKTTQFFDLLERLNNLPSDYRLGKNSAIDKFIIQIEEAIRPSEYSGYQITQGDLEKILHIGTKALSNEFNLGLVTEESQWKEIFQKISREKRSYFIASNTHAVAMSFENGKYTLYDPNYTWITAEFNSAEELIKELKNCFQYKDSSFGLVIRSYANPNAAPEQYPTHDEVHSIAFTKQADTESSLFAALAADNKTLNYLFTQNRVNLETLGRHYLRPEFNELLMQQPKSTALKNALLKGIEATFYTGNNTEAEQLIDHYQKTYTTNDEQKDLKKTLQRLLSYPVKEHLILLKNESDYSRLQQLFHQLNLTLDPDCQTKINHLQLLTFVKKAVEPIAISQFLDTLSPE